MTGDHPAHHTPKPATPLTRLEERRAAKDILSRRERPEPSGAMKQLAEQSEAVKKARLMEAQGKPSSTESKPWHGVTDEDIVTLFKNTAMQPVFEAHRAPTIPPLPVPVALLKTLVLTGCALTGEEKSSSPHALPTMGIQRAKLAIMSAGGQACNVYAMLVASSSTGKDIGNVTQSIAFKKHWRVSSGGSAEGLADALMDVPNGLVTISEFMNYIDKRSWQSNAASFLTAAFNEGHYHMSMSRRNESKPRKLDYCFPNVIANVQPGVLARKATSIDLQSGFMGRFIFAEAYPTPARPKAGDLDAEINEAVRSLERYTYKWGRVEVGDNYLQDVFNMFLNNGADLDSHWRRLVNEYGPRFAVMFSVDDQDRDECSIHLKPSHWEKAATLIKYLYTNAEHILAGVDNEEQDKRFEGLCDRIERIIRDHATPQEGVSRQAISRLCGRRSRASEREAVIHELMERGLITEISGRFYAGTGLDAG